MQHHFIHEALDYKAIAADPDFQYWLESGTFEIISDHIYRVFQDFIHKKGCSEDTQFSVNGNSYGFVFRHSQFSYEDLKFFQLVLVHKLKEINYIVNLAEKKSNPHNKNSSTPNLVYYLKPSLRLSFGREKSVQLYGNIHMECMNDLSNTAKIRFITHSYNDSNYDAALPFGGLMDILFKKSDN